MLYTATYTGYYSLFHRIATLILDTQGNILIKDDGEACITDFGISALSRQLYPDAESHPNMREHPPNLGNSFLSRFERHGEFTGINKLITMFGDTERPTRDSHQPIPTHWMFKPREELVLTESATTFTQAMDVYSFACTVYSVDCFIIVSTMSDDPIRCTLNILSYLLSAVTLTKELKRFLSLAILVFIGRRECVMRCGSC